KGVAGGGRYKDNGRIVMRKLIHMVKGEVDQMKEEGRKERGREEKRREGKEGKEEEEGRKKRGRGKGERKEQGE
ncbi:hypothetical protein, partial [Brevundimonas diminuta]|uniref:hypothetical protein n=1 Tax=Brevundimonas diminuta TaxID=293 RepID=UPI001CC2A2F2